MKLMGYGAKLKTKEATHVGRILVFKFLGTPSSGLIHTNYLVKVE